jgi:hypothetical protein
VAFIQYDTFQTSSNFKGDFVSLIISRFLGFKFLKFSSIILISSSFTLSHAANLYSPSLYSIIDALSP